MRVRSRPRRRPQEAPPEPKIVLAGRSDGLGQRLFALVNAMRLAEILEVDFRFEWPTTHVGEADHAIAPAEEFFSADFVAAHRLDRAAAEGEFVPVAKATPDLASLECQLSAAPRGLRASNRALARRINPGAVPAVLDGYSSEFKRIGFHPRVQDALLAARSVQVEPGSVGLHLRAGDAMHGKFRTWNRYSNKVMPAPVTRDLIETNRAEGRQVIVFGQDAALITELCGGTGAIPATTLRPVAPLSRPAEAMFDLGLLSRCDTIISGGSGFAAVAAKIGNRSFATYASLVSPSEQVAITRRDLAKHGHRYDATNRAFAWWIAYYRARGELSYDDAVELVSRALEADATNPRSRLRLAALHFAEGHVSRGDDVLVDALAADLRAGSDALESVLLFSLRTSSGLDGAELFDPYERAIGLGSVPALPYRAALRAQLDDPQGARADVAAFCSRRTEIPRLVDRPEVDLMLEATIDERLRTGGKPA